MRYFKCIVEYDGTSYSGWQRQKNTPHTIQEKIENALRIIAKEQIPVMAASRTDAGVHAYGQVIGFKMKSGIPLEKLSLAMNGLLPTDIRIKEAREVDQDFHPRFQAIGKIYNYYLDNRNIQSVFQRNYAYHIPIKLDISNMKKSSKYLIGTNDFSSFRASGCSAKSPVRTLKRIDVEKKDDFIRLEFEGDGFLYNMVRILTGTLVYAGMNKFTSLDVRDILDAQDRTLAGPTVPAHGLYLVKVFYGGK